MISRYKMKLWDKSLEELKSKITNKKQEKQKILKYFYVHQLITQYKSQ